MFASSCGMAVFALCLAYPSFLQQSELGLAMNMRGWTNHLTDFESLRTEPLALFFSGCQPFFARFLKRSAILALMC